MVKARWRAAIVVAAVWAGGTAVAAGGNGPPEFRDCRDCPPMVVLPAGSFLFGADEAETRAAGVPPVMGRSEMPVRHITLPRPLAMARTPVTRSQFARFVRSTGRTVTGCYFNDRGTARENPALSWRDPGFRQTGADPAVCASPEDADAYAAWLSRTTGKSYRLPSEAEWEYAARAGTTGPRIWPDAADPICRHANIADRAADPAELVVPASLGGEAELIADCTDGFAHTAPVGRFPANDFGLSDMLGNVWQITADCWTPDHATAPADGAPVTTRDCQRRVYKGGAWNSAPAAVRPAARNQRPATLRGYSSGFRVVRILEQGR